MNQQKTGNFIKNLRNEKNITQEKLASELHVDRTLVNKWEKGTASLTSEHIKSLSNYFKASTDEIISGELINKENKDKINETKYEIYDKYIKVVKKFKYLIMTIIILILLFLLYFFITFYNSVSIYNVHVDSKDIEVNDGVLIKTRDYLIFNLNIDRENFRELTLYSEIDYKEENILRTNNNYIYIIDYIDNQEYFDFDKINEIIKNLHLKVEFDDGKVVNSKLDIKRMYSNNKLFVKPKKEYKEDVVTKNVPPSLLRERYEEVYQLYPDYSGKVKVNNINYDVVIFEDNMTIEYSFDNSNYMIMYTKFDNEFISKSKNYVELYSDILNRDKCVKDDCNDDIKLLNEILDFLLENKK